jgi:integrase
MKLRRTRYQNGSLQQSPRKGGDPVWVYRYSERQPDGSSKRRAVTVGPVSHFPTLSAARKAAGHLRIAANEHDNVQQERKTLSHVIDRFITEEMSARKSTQDAYLLWLENYIRPKWGSIRMTEIRPLEVRAWLKGLCAPNGKPLSDKSKSHVHGLMRQMFGNAMLWEWFPFGENPMKLIRLTGSSKRRKHPTVLTLEQFNALLEKIPGEPFRSMVLLAVCTGMRKSELIALKWGDINFAIGELTIQRGIARGCVEGPKTRESEAKTPISPDLMAVLEAWRATSLFPAPEDWVFASPYFAGEKPRSANAVYEDHIRPAGNQLGLQVGWHTFRHTYRTLLDETGAPMSVQQKLMRHADIRTTMNVYGGAMPDSMRSAQGKVVEMVIPQRRKA